MREYMKQEKPQGALTPPLFSLPLGSKIYYGQVKVGDLSYLLRAYDDNTRKAPGALDPAVVLPLPPGGCKICYGHSR